MKELSTMPESDRRAIVGVLFDIDDTFTTGGRVTATAYGALERLQRAGIMTVPVTGRPAGWCDHIARMWPVDAVVGENGAFYFRYDRGRRKMCTRFMQDECQRRHNRLALENIACRVLAKVSGAAIACDQRFRETDLAIDYCEDVERLPAHAVDRIVEIFEAQGATAKVSSIHVNGWFGDHDKLSMTRIAMRECFDIDLDGEKSTFLFVGDSPNDGTMFRYFPASVGVANVNDFCGRLEAPPTYVTQRRSGEGFAEVVETLLAVRR